VTATRLITLTAWAASRYGDAAPRLATLRRWAREQRIFPTPEKHGRTYFVRPDAEYLDTGTLKHEPSKARRLAEKLARSPA
jgi:hypothetical protein